jgi:virginiamycin B lyase
LQTKALPIAIAAVLALSGCGSSASHKVTEFDLPDKDGSTHELTLGPDGNVWVTQQTQDKLVRVTPDGDQRAFAVPPGSGPHGVRFDSHGSLWITLEVANAIARIDQTGQIAHTYPIPSPGAGPHGLDIARDGSVWWTGKAGGVIGRLDPSTGRMRVFPLPDRGSKPIYIAQGCNGMYFTELAGSRIGRITTSGQITEWATPTAHAMPIAVAPHNCRIWFSEAMGHHFGVLDPQKPPITEYPLPKPDEQLAGLAFDRTGRLWLQYVKPDLIGLVGAGMKVREFPIPTKGATMHRIILGPGGNMWFTELASDKVGYIRTR